MSRYLLMLTVWIGSSFAARSQTTDTLCFPVPVIQKVLIAAKQKALTDSLNAVLRSDISLLQQSVEAYRVKDSVQQQVARTYEAMVGTLGEQKAVLQGQINVLNREVRRCKRKTTLSAVGGLLLTGMVTFLFITK